MSSNESDVPREMDDVIGTRDGECNWRSDESTKSMGETDIEYNLNQIPPVPVLLTSALQHLLTCLPTSLAFSFIVADVICAPHDSILRAKLFSAELFMCGVTTLIQTFLGIRLPIFQGPSGVFLPTILALQKNAVWTCADHTVQDTARDDGNKMFPLGVHNSNITLADSLSSEEKLQQLSGSLMAASLVEIIVGASGLVGLVMRFVGPITVAVTVILLGLSLIEIPIMYSKASWELALCGALLTVLFGLYLRHISVPVFSCNKQEKGKKRSFPLFQLFSILLSVGLIWIISAILTFTNVFPPQPDNPYYRARTDAKINLINMTPWFQISYPGQFGMPSFNVAIFIGFIIAFCASIVESVGDYLATARACHVPSPPNHAVNRGIMIEGIAALLSGAVGVGHATTSLSQNVAVIALSGTCSRAVLLCAGVFLVLISVVGKLGAAIATIPDPALGGILVVLFGMLVSLGLSSLRFVRLDSSRNPIILGISLFVGILVPEWIRTKGKLINTGNVEVDGLLKIVLGTPMFLGGVLSLILDNTVKGSPGERGAGHVTSADDYHGDQMTTEIYSWSCFQRANSKLDWCSFLPFMPSRTVKGIEESTK